MALKPVKLDDKFDLSKSHVFMTGTQAIVRLTLMQRARDERDGLNTAGYVTGYRGSPVGGLDQQFMRSVKYTEPATVRFEPGINEDLAATAIWGSQQAEMRGEGAYDGVFSIWYGKGPGVDRTGDVLRHANSAGSSKHGGVLALMGDDHGAESSTIPHQSEFAMMDAMIPVLHPAGLQEILDYGIYGFALSRYSGCWVGLKCVHDNIESAGIADGSVDRIKINLPKDFKMPEGGLNIRPSDDRFEQEYRLHNHKRYAAVAFARANKLDKIILSGGKAPKIGIVSTGKSYLDVRQALDDLGIDEVASSRLGLRLLKVAMVWPLDPQIVDDFTKGLDLVIVVEEKRSLLESQLREQLCNDAAAPIVIGKKDEKGNTLFPAWGTLEPNQIAIAIADRLLKKRKSKPVEERLGIIKASMAKVSNSPNLAERIPYFCSGCPHNSSTVLPDGGRGYAGIGCHWMVQYIPERNTEGATHMGGEGANWIGEAPFSTRKHVFQNLGDGTYNHSGLMAIRAAVASGVNMTYKILFNDAVAMTGGQTHEGGLTVPQIAQQVRAEGVDRIAIVTDEPWKYPSNAGFPDRVSVHHRSELQTVQKEMMEVPGISSIIYDQTCAAEKRRRRKRGTFPDPDRRVFINELVCEGCGDCGVQSNCVAIAPKETEFGRKRQIDQSACNKDFSCLKGFCPSFVTIEGGELVKGVTNPVNTEGTPFPVLPAPEQLTLDEPWAMMITGIGGTGVVTIGHLIGMAANLDGKGVAMIDMAGLSQKNGAVVTHLKLARTQDEIASIRIAAGGADVLLGCDIVTSASERILSGASRARTHAIVNSYEVMPAQFTRDADFNLPGSQMQVQIEARTKQGASEFIDATRIATALLGDSIASNLFTLGYAWQKGLVPVSEAAINRAIELNGVAIKMNQQAFLWGRRAAHDLPAVEAVLSAGTRQAEEQPRTLDEEIKRREEFLTAYQNAAYAGTYRRLVDDVRSRETKVVKGSEKLTAAVARYLFKLMAYKDEYEVARLYTDGSFAKSVAARFKGDYEIRHHLAPPLLAKRDAETGHLLKQEYGPWMMQAFAVLAKLKRLRGTALDPFGRTAERRMERQLITDYRDTLSVVLSGLKPANLGLAVEIASVPEDIRGYGHVKERHVAEAKANEATLLDAYKAGKSRAPVFMAAE
ncbi:MAG: indolepyruvate ferredoxin oxidoreductase family protein [Anderseniella sp.]